MAVIGVLLRLIGAVTARQKPRMARRHQAGAVKQGGSFKGRQFTAEVILWAVRWYLMFPVLSGLVPTGLFGRLRHRW